MTRRPIGYWLKHVDHLIESTFEHALAAEGLTRRHWQVLNTVATGPTTRAELDVALAPFLVDDPLAASRALDDLVARGWVDDALSLTVAGRAGYGTVSERIQQSRRSIMTGISDEEYARTVGTLEQMAHNLEPVVS
jgi:DNA-binding MarR family transcriptional regulator